MQVKLRGRTGRLLRSSKATGKFVPYGIDRASTIPELSAYRPTSTPTPIATFTPTPSPSLTPTITPTETPVPTPTPTRLFDYDASFTGPGESELLLLSMYTGEDTIYVKTLSAETLPETRLMNVYVNEELRSTIEYNRNRAFTSFGYRRSTSTQTEPEFVGQFPDVSFLDDPPYGEVYFTI